VPVLTTSQKSRYKAPKVRSSGTVRIGLVGYGYWGPNLVRNFHEIPTAEITALCDLREDRLKPLARKFPSAKLTTHHEELIRDKSIDALIIATPISTHYEIARQALTAGKHVMIEKPLAQNVRQAMILTQLARRHNRILMVGHTFEYNPAVLKVAEILKAGEVGKLFYIDSVRVNLGLHQSDGLNVIWDLAPHDLSIILHWVGEVPKKVSASGRAFVRSGVEDVAFLHLEFPGGVLAHIHLSWLAPTKIRRMTVVGDKKMVVYDDLESAEKIKVADRGVHWDPANPQLKVGYRMGDIVSPRVEVKEPLSEECNHFIQCILQNTRPLTDGEKGLQVVRVLEAADRSLKRGGIPISL